MNDKVHILIASFLRIAREDLNGARLLAAEDNRNAIYLCEQAAEKVIRAVLTSEGVHAGIRHSLRQMVDEGVPDENPLKPSLGEIAALEDYATSYGQGARVGDHRQPHHEGHGSGVPARSA